jgi:hypothetical protein
MDASEKENERFVEELRRKAESSRSLDDYIAFLMAVQKIKPFEHKRVITPAGKNIL